MRVLRTRATSRMAALPEVLSLAPCLVMPSKRWAERMISPAAGSVPGMTADRRFRGCTVSFFDSTWAWTVIFSFGHQPLLEDIALADGKLEAELGRGRRGRGRGGPGRPAVLAGGAARAAARPPPGRPPRMPPIAGPGHLERIEVGPRTG